MDKLKPSKFEEMQAALTQIAERAEAEAAASKRLGEKQGSYKTIAWVARKALRGL